jgi:hypothetical protein
MFVEQQRLELLSIVSLVKHNGRLEQLSIVSLVKHNGRLEQLSIGCKLELTSIV